MLRTIHITALILFFSVCARTQDIGYFDQVWQQEGLSQSQVSDLVQDKDGFMWIGTQDGLNRFDGSSMKIFNFHPFDEGSLSDDFIWNLGIDSKNNIYICSGGHLDLLTSPTGKVEHVKVDSAIRFLHTWVLDDDIWAWTSKGLMKLVRDRKTWKTQFYPIDADVTGNKNFSVTGMTRAADGSVLAIAQPGIFILRENQQRFTNFAGEKKLRIPRLVRTLQVYGNYLCFSAENKFYVLRNNKIDSVVCGSLPESYITCADVDRTGQIWAGTNGAGVYVISITADGKPVVQHHFCDKNIPHGLTSHFITSVRCSRVEKYDQVWIGTRDAGVFVYQPYKNHFRYYSGFTNEPTGNFYGMVKDADGIIWAGSTNGLYRIDPATGESKFIDLSHIPNPARNVVESVYLDDGGNVWMGLGNALYRINRMNLKPELILNNISPNPRTNILKIARKNENEIYLGTREGYAVYNLRTGEKTFYASLRIAGQDKEPGGVDAFCTDTDGNLWLGTGMGLVMITPNNENNRLFTYKANDQKSLLSMLVMDVCQHPNGKIYVATNKGLSVTDPHNHPGEFNHYTGESGLSSSFIYGLLIDKTGKIWMPTNKGISVFDPETELFRTYHNYEGIRFDEFNSGGFHRSADGEFLFAGIGGIVGVYPDALREKVPAAAIYLETLRINGNIVNTSISGKKLSWHENDIELTFSVTDFYNPKGVTLRYHLKGAGKEWISLGSSRIISLANLAPGQYILEVESLNEDGVVANPVFSLPFSINAPFWKTTWFVILVILVIMCCAWLIYRQRYKRKIRRFNQLQQIRQQESEKARKAAALDLHDEFGNGLTRISMLTQMVKSGIAETDKEAQQSLQIITEHTSRLYQGTKDFIWSIHPGNDSLYETLIRVKDQGDELLYDSGIKFELRGLTENMRLRKHDPSVGRNIAMIFKEAIYNIVKHAHATEVVFQVEENKEIIVLSIRDNGSGFDNVAGQDHFGLANMKQRAQRINATLEINSARGKGCRITLNIPNSIYEKNSSH